MGAVTHYLCEGLRAELPSHAKPLFLMVLVLTLFPPLRTLTHLHRHMFSDVRVPLCRLCLCALSSSSPCVFPGAAVSCSPPFWDGKWAERDLAVHFPSIPCTACGTG